MSQAAATSVPKRVAEPILLMMIQEMVATIERTTPTSDVVDEETAALAVHVKLEALGYDVGYRYIERVGQQRLIPSEPLEAIKLVCKELWQGVFGKSIDKLQTNHRGVFVLKDNSFRWIARHSGKSDIDVKQMQMKSLKFPAGLLRGALANLGYTAVVTADIDTVDSRQITSFHVKLS
jgi:hypothetical protein